MFDTENEFYNEHKDEYRQKYLGKHLVIQDNELKGIYDSDGEALASSLKSMKSGTFMIKVVTPTDEEDIIRFTSRVYV